MMQIVDGVSVSVSLSLSPSLPVCVRACMYVKISDALQFTTSSLRHSNTGLTWNLEVILKASEPNVNYNSDKKNKKTQTKTAPNTTTMLRRDQASYF